MEATLDQISPLLPIDFFHIVHDLHFLEKKGSLGKQHQLADFSSFLFETSFAKVAMGWNGAGLSFAVHVGRPFQECFFPEYRKGDSVELFIDTRDLKSAGFLTRFCHHFVILPRAVEGIQAQEVTHFRSEESHELCDADKIELVADFQKSRYELQIFIPSECLHGYDPASFERLGFTYRINRWGGEGQHFAVSSSYLAIEQQPSLWSTLHMRKK